MNISAEVGGKGTLDLLQAGNGEGRSSMGAQSHQVALLRIIWKRLGKCPAQPSHVTLDAERPRGGGSRRCQSWEAIAE